MEPSVHTATLRPLPFPGATARATDPTERVLELTLAAFADAAELPLEPAVVEAFRATYRRSAARAADRRIWGLVGDQLLYWLAHQGQLARAAAGAREADSVSVADLRSALRECWRIHASIFCEPDVPPPFRI